ncbi:class I SAM-dependent methyltransferase [Variovorax sp. J22P240]|uniref:class I SAM-dependent methyltransferase n=1 Tax=Variovorax sp. J22P240 TaxID=3053514 RepID=UPI002578B865|nr:class I SAM-dependent methyltransferase [Variovorax sp. J22P240]MDM0001801.1 class I SAM-dependent methyltransferase [Variovorax sp. J22P240]
MPVSTSSFSRLSPRSRRKQLRRQDPTPATSAKNRVLPNVSRKSHPGCSSEVAIKRNSSTIANGSCPSEGVDQFTMKFIEHALAHRWCLGEGLEIGAAAHNPFGLRSRNVALREAFYEQAQIDMCGEVAPIDIEASADEIPLDGGSQDFIISSHVVEHLPNPVRAFLEWNRLLRPGGICFIIHPLPSAFPGDESRPLTTTEHYLEDFDKAHDRSTHPLEGVNGGVGGHYHVASAESLDQLVHALNARALLAWERVDMEAVDTKVGNGFTLVYRKAPG